MKFLVDVNASGAVVQWLEAQGHDVAQVLTRDERMKDDLTPSPGRVEADLHFMPRQTPAVTTAPSNSPTVALMLPDIVPTGSVVGLLVMACSRANRSFARRDGDRRLAPNNGAL